MITTFFLLLTAATARAAELPPLPGMPGASVVVSTPVAAPAANASVIAAPLLPPKIPARPKGTLDTAGEVARDLAVRVEYFENGQAYYRAYTKGSHTPEENKAFVQFLEDYENELGIAKRTHAILGVWLEKKSSIKD
ncbi:MAG: hypothetical protein NDJ72_03645 [Elusimicrobia bacterium]|nr:hypothetical protein [Elusimicrobiota bacterium]